MMGGVIVNVEPTPGRRLVTEMLGQQGLSPQTLALEVDPRDEMLAFARQEAGGDPDRGFFQYFRAGLTVAVAHHQLLLWRFGSLSRVGGLLDFASGFGRVTRFLVPHIPPDRIQVCDIQPGASEFQERLLGVRALDGASRPEDFVAAGRYDAVLVTSLFTHLPEPAFVSWLKRLAGLLGPGGILVFTTLDPAVTHPPLDVPEGGFLFHEVSESQALPGAEYGTAFATGDFVERAAAAAAPGAALHRIPRGLAGFQDLWLLVPEADCDFSSLRFQGAPELHLRGADIRDGCLVLHGWAACRSGSPPREVEVRFDGVPAARVPVGSPRPEVAADQGAHLLDSGWECEARLPRDRPRSTITVLLSVVDEQGRYWPVVGGTVPELMLEVRDLQTRWLENALNGCQEAARTFEAWVGEETSRLRGRIEAMEASRFWKLRNAWFRLKRDLGLTEEE
jgi:SAM-dependent methyltransferase